MFETKFGNTSNEQIISQYNNSTCIIQCVQCRPLFLEEQLTVAISRKSVFSPSVLAKRELFSSSSAALAIAEPSSHSKRTPPAINTRYTHQERKMISAQNIKITSYHIMLLQFSIILVSICRSFFFLPGCAIKSGSGLRIRLNSIFPPTFLK